MTYDGDSFGIREFTAWKDTAENGESLELRADDMDGLIRRLSSYSTHEINIEHKKGMVGWYLQLTYCKQHHMLERFQNCLAG